MTLKRRELFMHKNEIIFQIIDDRILHSKYTGINDTTEIPLSLSYLYFIFLTLINVTVEILCMYMLPFVSVGAS